MIKDQEDRVRFILNRLGVFEEEFDEDMTTMLDILYEKVNKLSKVCDYLSFIFKLLIESDVIPPAVLKKSKVYLQIADHQSRLERVIERYERNKNNKAPDKVLDEDIEQIGDIKKKIRQLQEDASGTQ